MISLSPYKDITLLSTIFPTLHILQPWFIYLVTGSLLISLIYFPHPPNTPNPSTTCLYSVSVTLFLFCYVCFFVFFLDSTYKWNHTVFVFLCLTFHRAQCSLGLYVLSQMARFHSFFFIIIIDFWLHQVLVAHAFSSCGEQSLLSSWGPWAASCRGVPYCGAQALGHAGCGSCSSRVQWLQLTGIIFLLFCVAVGS